MARKRNKRLKDVKPKSQARHDWKLEDEIELLAWLDCIRGTSKDAGLIKSSLVVHLEKGRHTKYTVPQIERKIRTFWDTNHHIKAVDPNEIYRLGTKCLPGLSKEYRKKIEDRLSTLKGNALVERLHCPRRLRSASQTVDSEPAHHISLGVDVVETPSPRKRPRVPLSSSAAIDDARPPKRRDGQSKLDQAYDVCSTEPDAKLPKQEEEADAAGRPCVPQVIVDSQDELTDDGDCGSPTDRLSREHQTALPASDLYQMPRKDKTAHLEESGPRRIQQDGDLEGLERELPLSRKRWEPIQDEHQIHKNTIRSLRHQLSVVQGNCKDLQQQLDCLASPLLSQPDNRAMIKAITANQKEISELQEALNDKERFRAFSTLSSTDPLPLDARNVQTEMAYIGDLIKNIMLDYEYDGLYIASSFEWQSEFSSLFRRSFGLDLPDQSSPAAQALDLSTFSFQAVVRSLTASALCEWVFESDLQDICETPCALLHEYRALLAKQDGEIAVRNLDFAANTSFFQGDFFQKHVIPAKAAVLADRLIYTLNPLFAQKEGSEDPDQEVVEEWSNKRIRLAEVFEHALRIKAQATVSKDLFEMALYSPGTPFDKGIMEPETMEGDRMRVLSSNMPGVKLCLVPALHVYDHDRKIVDYNNFVQRPSSRSSRPINLTKATVVLESVLGHNHLPIAV